ncbi:MAG: 16S rRNA (uracil(1498)-N(3))-methyltransferase [Acidimicrobiales bacterium]
MSSGASVSRLLREAAALVYVSDLAAPELAAEDAHHLTAVLRLRPGEVVVASDGAGRYRGCRVTTGDASARGAGSEAARPASARRGRPPAITLLPDTDVVAGERTSPEVTVGFSLAKGDRNDWAVAKLSELGVDRIVPLACERTAVRWEPQAATRHVVRLRRIAREASMQARRVWLPEVLDLLPLSEAATCLGGGIAFAEPGGGTPSLATPVVLVGPEGGFTAGELAVGFPRVTLGDTILRIETAAVVAGAILTALRAGVLAPIVTGEQPAVSSDRSE